ncbi:MAG: PDZ domain-containing protein [Gemmataceae bacterium]|nr:PDZ domain-containing protein [Gemmataceae bacterium]
MRVGFILAAALTFVALPVVADDPVKPAKVAFQTLPTQHMMVQITVNGKGPYRVIFDTGAPVTLLSNKVAREAGVFPKNYKPGFALFGSAGQFKVKQLEMGDLKVENIDAMVMDHPTVGALAAAVGPIEGIVGFNVFAKFRSTLDYQAKEMTFIPTSFVPANMMEKMMESMLSSKNAKGKAKVLAPGGLLGVRPMKDSADMESGITLEHVYADSPAAKAGLKSGDRLLTLDHRWTDSVSDLFIALSKADVTATLPLEVLRDGKSVKLEVKLAAGQ